ncbi:MAG: hypothetical protein K8I29_19850 [Alphaproteobacteria bacterium]|uniref:Uncharacterized protein n=1 Tax=Candidatus Nitrobium versatile TaxID=2884831 RepID=A0A953SI58_9BACT|nr:hypothetical protein [Candidatus Nitrobium versatile]
MDAMMREQLEDVLLRFAEVFSEYKIPEDAFETALHDALDAIDALLRSGPVTAEWLTDEYEVIRDSNPALSTEEIMKRLAAAINEKLRGE